MIFMTTWDMILFDGLSYFSIPINPEFISELMNFYKFLIGKYVGNYVFLRSFLGFLFSIMILISDKRYRKLILTDKYDIHFLYFSILKFLTFMRWRDRVVNAPD